MKRFIISILAIFSIALSVSPALSVDSSYNGALVVLIYDTHCKVACEKVRPVISGLKSQYPFEYVELDASDEHLSESKRAAKELGLYWFLADYAQFVPVVGFFTPKRKCVKFFIGPKTSEVYSAALEKAIAETK